MLKTALRLFAFLMLGLLLVYLPEIYTAVSSPYYIETPPRVLLRLSLCTSDLLSADAFFDALSSYMKEHPSIHIRVIRTNTDPFLSSVPPSCDLLLFPDTAPYDRTFFLEPSDGSAPFIRFSPPDGTPLLCGVSCHTRHPDQAFSLAGYLRRFAADESHSRSSIE